jgi:predicted amidohydrolase YtcJ
MPVSSPDTQPILYINARFHTLNSKCPIADALLSEGGRIVAVGNSDRLLPHLPPGTRTVDLEGRVALPGFTDSHIHTASLARSLEEVDLRKAASLEEALAQVETFAAGIEPGRWIFGGWWDFNKWDIPVQPDLRGLDVLCPRNPVALTSADGHTMWANSLALAAIGVDASTPDPAGGEIVRFTDGTPSGILRESALIPLRQIASSPLSGDLPAQLRKAQDRLLAVGITSIHDIDGADCLQGYQQLRADGSLALRVHKLLSIPELDGAIASGTRTGDGDEWIRTGAVKIFSDGALGSRTCHMSEHFPGEEGNFGIAVNDYNELLEIATRASSAGIAVAAHAIGDQANHNVLRAYEELAQRAGGSHLRHRIEHAQFLKPEDVATMARLGVIASMQPTHCVSDLPLLDLLQGRDLAAYAWHTMLDAGVRLAFGSDAPVVDPNPFVGLHAAMTRQTATGEPHDGWRPGERISAHAAIHGFTTGAAFASGEEHLKGQLSPGMLADFISIDIDPFAASPDEVLEANVYATVVNGAVRYHR